LRQRLVSFIVLEGLEILFFLFYLLFFRLRFGFFLDLCNFAFLFAFLDLQVITEM
jgi:hypothetical protein